LILRNTSRSFLHENARRMRRLPVGVSKMPKGKYTGLISVHFFLLTP
jgi:hypothetical protein